MLYRNGASKYHNHATSLDSVRIDLPNQRGDLLGLQFLFGQDDLNYEIASKSDENQSAHCNLVLHSALEIHPSAECGRALGPEFNLSVVETQLQTQIGATGLSFV